DLRVRARPRRAPLRRGAAAPARLRPRRRPGPRRCAMTRLATTLALAALYLGVLGSAAPLDLACGLLLGGVLAFAFTQPGALGGPREVLRRFLYFPLFVVGVVREVARGFLGMARVLLGARDWRRQGFVEVDVGARTSVGVTVSALV